VAFGELGEGRSAAFLGVQGLQQIEPAGEAANHGVFGTAILAHRRKPLSKQYCATSGRFVLIV
jgi:hypothetical protein